MPAEYNPVGWFEIPVKNLPRAKSFVVIYMTAPDIVSTLERVKKGGGRGRAPRFGPPPPCREAA